MSGEFQYGFRAFEKFGVRRLTMAAAAFLAYCNCDTKAQVEKEAYLSAFQFGDDFAELMNSTHSERGFDGPVWAPYLWWDIDRENSLHAAQDDARRLCVYLGDQLGVGENNALVFFSGAKGFHVGIPTALWSPEPSHVFNLITRTLAVDVAVAADVSVIDSKRGTRIDVSIYSKTRLFRAPNSRHPKTNLYKRHLTVDEVLHLSTDAVLQLAQHPEAFDLPDLAGIPHNAKLAATWTAASDQACEQENALERRRREDKHGQNRGTLNRLTMEFIRDGAGVGDRHRLLYSAARNLAEFGCPPALAHALLTESALDTGLSPSDVRRQIECGLTGGAKGGAG